jgi:AmiR/NasT family two-component response regulator
MTGQRLVQNFRGMRALLWCAPGVLPDTLLAALEPPLHKLGVALALAGSPDLADIDGTRDIVLLDGDGDLDAAQLLSAGAARLGAPVVGLVGVEAPSRLKALFALGATAFLRKPVHGAAVYASLFLAVNGFHRHRSLEQRLAEHDLRRRGRRFVIKAVVHLVTSQGMDDDAAYELLRRESMRTRQSIEEYCEALVTNAAVLPRMSLQPQKETEVETQIAADRGLAGRDGVAGRGGAGR